MFEYCIAVYFGSLLLGLGRPSFNVFLAIRTPEMHASYVCASVELTT